jgi:hypothetical protein
VTFRAFAFDADNPGFFPQDRRADGTLTPLIGTPATVRYAASNLPAGATFDPVTALFSWTPGFDAAGTYQVTFTAIDDGNGTGAEESATITVPITILNANRTPTIDEIGLVTIAAGETRTITGPRRRPRRHAREARRPPLQRRVAARFRHVHRSRRRHRHDHARAGRRRRRRLHLHRVGDRGDRREAAARRGAASSSSA